MSLFQLEHVQDLFFLTLDLNPTANFAQTLKTFALFFYSRNRFDECGAETVHQYGRSDVVQCFERLIYVYHGVAIYETVEVDRELQTFVSNGVKVHYKKLIQFKYPHVQIKHY